MTRRTEIFARLARLDRRWIFLALLVATAAPFVLPFHFAASPGPETLRFDRALARALASDKPLLVDVDFGPQTMAEMEPLLLAVMHDVFAHRRKAIFMTLMPEAATPLRRYLSQMGRTYGLEYGVDYVFLGYASAYAYAIYALGTDVEAYFKADDRGTPVERIPIMRGVRSLRDVSAVVNIASNAMPRYWITYGVAPFGFDLLMACTAVQATDYYPFLQSGQLKGMLAGGRAGAELEGLLVERKVMKRTGDATRGLGSQTMAFGVIIAFVVAGNLGWFLGGRGRRG
jgi:hypothetical protein